jgi:2-haloacid dehalogenase
MTRGLPARPRAFVFDLGGVVVDWNPRNLYRKLFARPDAMERFLEEIGFAEWNLEQDRGRPFAEGVEVLSRRFPHHGELIAAYHERWVESISGPIAGTVDILRELRRAGHPLAALTNWSAEKFELVSGTYGFLDWFDPLVVSGREGICKPDPRIYGLLLQRAGWAAEGCIFIDDSPVNVAAATELGFQAILFESPERLRDELGRRGVLPPGGGPR